MTTATLPPQIDEVQWLLDNPHFEERPATLEEFLGPSYLNCRDGIREGVMEVLRGVLADDVPLTTKPVKVDLALSTGGIGIGKTTLASIILCYCVHWTLCLKDPQGYFNLMPGSRIAFAMTATRKEQAKEVVFGDVKARISNSLWFKKHPFDKKFKNQMRFPKDVWLVPGDSTETAFEGYNVLGFILDEMDSYKITQVKDYAEAILTTLTNRTKSRFGKRGFGILVGQMKSNTGFAARKLEEFGQKGRFTHRMAIWDSWGWDAYANPELEDLYMGVNPDGTATRFYYDTGRKVIVPNELIDNGSLEGDADNILEIPMVYQTDFLDDPVKALRDLAGVPPLVGDPFISQAYKINHAAVKVNLKTGETEDRLFNPVDPDGRIAEHWRATNSLPRFIHIDIGYSPNGDALGFAMGHIPRMVDIRGEVKPYIEFDILRQWRAQSGNEVYLQDIRQFIYDLKDVYGFKIAQVSLDGFQSTDTLQQLDRKARIRTELISVDRERAPYYDLRDAINEERIAWPRYLVRSKKGDGKLLDLPFSELSQLVDAGTKVDHTANSTKDLADAMAAVTYALMGARHLHRNRRRSGGLYDAAPRTTSTTKHAAFGGLHYKAGPSSASGVGSIGNGRYT